MNPYENASQSAGSAAPPPLGFGNYPPPTASSNSDGAEYTGAYAPQGTVHYQPSPLYNVVSATAGFDATRSRDEKFKELINKYEIGHDFANRLQMLTGFKISFIFDDSSSMNSLLSDSPLLKQQKQVTRWNELEYFASIAIELANLFDQSGCDVYFLNKPTPMKNIRNVPEFLSYFRQFKPHGYTPLARTLDQVLRDNLNLVNYERKLLIVIVTDGEPTDERGNSDVDGFKRCLKSRKPADRIFTTIIACTDQNDSMDYLNDMDRTLKNLDVVDDFRNEKKEINKKRGSSFPFSYGDYVVKALIGSIDSSIDQFDEKKGAQGGGLFKKFFHK